MRINLLAAACALIALVSAPARADDFCTSLTTVLDAAGGRFASIKGPADSFIPDWYAGTVAVQGAETCVVDASGGDDAVSYFCQWPQKDAAAIADAYAGVVRQTDACGAGAARGADADRTIWRKPGAWKITVSHRRPSGLPTPGALILVVDRG